MSIYEQFKDSRPFYDNQETDNIFPSLLKELREILINVMISLQFDTLRLSGKDLNKLVIALVEFAEDIYCDIGLWSAYELFNKKCFGKTLPFSPKNECTDENFNITRIKHFLWFFYSELKPDIVINPAHEALDFIAQKVFLFFQENSNNIPDDSVIISFLNIPDDEYPSIKNRLVWLGTDSYIFRTSYLNYRDENGGEDTISLMDDFVCQNSTHLTGLSPICILSEVLNISKKQKKDLRKWAQRHFACYKIKRIDGNIVVAINLVSNVEYVIDAEEFANMFNINEVIVGSLIPWNGTWRWSGEQSRFGEINDEQIEELISIFITKTPGIVYRYNKTLLQKAQQSIKNHYDDFVNYFDDDLVLFPDGLSMASDLKKKEAEMNKTRVSKEAYDEFIEKHTLKNGSPDYSYPKELIECDNGIAVYYNPDEGMEIMRGFDDIVNGFEKKGKDLTEDDMEGIRMFIISKAISPGFVHKMIDTYGYDSILFSFLVEDDDKSNVEYLLRRHKGHFYRERYPALHFV